MVNVIPLNDEREHVHSTECWCEPFVEWADPVDGIVHENGPVIVHNAADCREACEEVTGASLSREKTWKAILG